VRIKKQLAPFQPSLEYHDVNNSQQEPTSPALGQKLDRQHK
jgi:hypothetical protein